MRRKDTVTLTWLENQIINEGDGGFDKTKYFQENDNIRVMEKQRMVCDKQRGLSGMYLEDGLIQDTGEDMVNVGVYGV